MSQMEFNPEQGRKDRDRGAERAADHAERVSPEWRSQAAAVFEEYAKRGEEFTCEDVRKFAYDERKLEKPPDDRARGAIQLHFKRSGRLKFVRYAQGKARTCHACPKSVWKWNDGQ